MKLVNLVKCHGESAVRLQKIPRHEKFLPSCNSIAILIALVVRGQVTRIMFMVAIEKDRHGQRIYNSTFHGCWEWSPTKEGRQYLFLCHCQSISSERVKGFFLNAWDAKTTTNLTGAMKFCSIYLFFICTFSWNNFSCNSSHTSEGENDWRNKKNEWRNKKSG